MLIIQIAVGIVLGALILVLISKWNDRVVIKRWKSESEVKMESDEFKARILAWVIILVVGFVIWYIIQII